MRDTRWRNNAMSLLWSTSNMARRSSLVNEWRSAASQLQASWRNSATYSTHFVRSANDTYETEWTFEGDQGLPDRFQNCQKNPTHANFIPVTSLELSHFPEEFRRPSLLTLTECLRDVTVRLSLNKVSSKRPSVFPGTNFEYPFGEGKHDGRYRFGSGRIRFVNEKDPYEDGTCPCRECQASSDPKEDWWRVGVVTATHVVFNKEEAVETTCRVGYDSEDSSLVTLDGYGIAKRGTFVEEDRCNVLFCTHDAALANRLAKCVADYKSITESVVQEFSGVPEDEKRLTIIVSHPHGYPKRVTFGAWQHKDKDKNGFTQYTYDADTCKGTSGAPVYVLDRKKLPFCNHPHSAAQDLFNYCGGGYG
ncbi:unnamed protein product [Lymnaea stagnalis]|uniref:Uncharacterized protein n=1 Tax=Lymnaea stagnalis TaxID=6523 RepID=A0AAV2H582_LYMST